jgi:tryptophan synthase
MVKEARARGLKAPVLLMGYYNPFLAYGLKSLMAACVASGVDGFIVCDLPPEEGVELIALSAEHGLSYVPLLTPTSTEERIARLAASARRRPLYTSFLIWQAAS